jgi:hypothetical protein
MFSSSARCSFIVRTCFKSPESLVFAGRGELPVRERISATSQAGRPSMMLPKTFRPVVIDAEFCA